MDVERIIDDIEQLQEMFEAPDIRPLSPSQLSGDCREVDIVEEFHDCDSRVRRSRRAVHSIHEFFGEGRDLEPLRVLSLARQPV
jgi:hypothetical protein